MAINHTLRFALTALFCFGLLWWKSRCRPLRLIFTNSKKKRMYTLSLLPPSSSPHPSPSATPPLPNDRLVYPPRPLRGSWTSTPGHPPSPGSAVAFQTTPSLQPSLRRHSPFPQLPRRVSHSLVPVCFLVVSPPPVLPLCVASGAHFYVRPHVDSLAQPPPLPSVDAHCTTVFLCCQFQAPRSSASLPPSRSPRTSPLFFLPRRCGGGVPLQSPLRLTSSAPTTCASAAFPLYGQANELGVILIFATLWCSWRWCETTVRFPIHGSVEGGGDGSNAVKRREGRE